MANDSLSAGYLSPQSNPAPLEDDALEDFFHDVLQQLSGLDATLVRPRWQPESPTQPERGSNWLAFGITISPADTYGVETQDHLTQHFQRHETLEILVSVYGPNARSIISIIRDSLQIEQNRDVLIQNAMGLQETTDIIPAPVLEKSKWLHRFDMTIIIRRSIDRDYSVLNILESDLYVDIER